MPGLIKHSIIKKRMPRESEILTRSESYVHVDSRTGEILSWNQLNSKLSNMLRNNPISYLGESKHYFQLKNNSLILKQYNFYVTALKKAIETKDVLKIKELKLKISKLPWLNKNKFIDWDISAIQDWQFVDLERKEFLGKKIRENAHGRILDIGSGSWNYFKSKLNEKKSSSHITAIDASKEMLLRSKANKRIQLDLNKIGIGKKLPFKDAEFDTLNLSFIINYIHPRYLSKTFIELDRITKKGGTILISGSQYLGLKEQGKQIFDSKVYCDILKQLNYTINTETIYYDNEIIFQSLGQFPELQKNLVLKEFCKLIIAHKPIK